MHARPHGRIWDHLKRVWRFGARSGVDEGHAVSASSMGLSRHKRGREEGERRSRWRGFEELPGSRASWLHQAVPQQPLLTGCRCSLSRYPCPYLVWCASCGARACDCVLQTVWVVWPSRTVHDFAEPRTGIFSAVQLSSATFATRKVCKLLLQIARLLSKVKVSKLFSQLFAPIKSVHEESCEKSLQTFTFFATFCSQKNRCCKRNKKVWVMNAKLKFVRSTLNIPSIVLLWFKLLLS